MPPSRRPVLILAAAQALFQTGAVIVMTVGALAGLQAAASPRWATLPIATMFLGTALATFPASLWMARVGRRAGFICGALLGVAAGLVAAAGVRASSLPLLAAGTFLFGTYQGFAQFYRFAAGEASDPAFRPRAISLVLAGGVIAALIGPLLVRLGGLAIAPDYLGAFLILSALSLVAAAILPGLRLSRPETLAGAAASARSLTEILRQPTYLVALFGAATGGGVMILAMTATPLAMSHHHHGLDATATVIQLHVLGMFLPSFFTGGLIARFGAVPVMFAGVLLLLGHVLATLTGPGFNSFAGALILLGVGWNFLFVGGSTLLTTAYAPSEKAKAQAFNDLTIFAVALLSSLLAGGLHGALGWERLNLLLLPWLLSAALALAWYARPRARGIPSGP